VATKILLSSGIPEAPLCGVFGFYGVVVAVSAGGIIISGVVVDNKFVFN